MSISIILMLGDIGIPVDAGWDAFHAKPRRRKAKAAELVAWNGFDRGYYGRFGTLWNGDQHLFLAVNQCGGVVARHFKTMSVGDGIGGTGLDTESTKDSAVVIDVVDLGVALAAADPQGVGIFGGLDIDAVGRAGGCA